MAADPPLEPTGAWLLLLYVGAWALLRSAVAFVRFLDWLDHLPPHPPERTRFLTRHPLRIAATIVGGLTALAQGLVGAGLFTAEQGNATTALIAAVVTLLGAFGIVIAAEPKVTPTADPRDNAGRTLAPAYDPDHPTDLD